MTERIHETFGICEAALAKNFSQDEIVLLRSLLKKMYTNMSEDKDKI